VWEDYTFSWEGGESNLEAQERGLEAIKEILQRYEGENIAIGTHGNIMVLIMQYFDKSFDFNFWKNLDMPDIYKVTFNGLQYREALRCWER
jgi:2,3-bisphosphoglycerate-dependent phosphoglycerate mutase